MSSILVIEFTPYTSKEDIELNNLAEQIMNTKIDGLIWGTYTFENVGFEIRKIIMTCNIVNTKISSESIIFSFEKLQEEEISKIDIVLWNRI